MQDGLLKRASELNHRLRQGSAQMRVRTWVAHSKQLIEIADDPVEFYIKLEANLGLLGDTLRLGMQDRKTPRMLQKAQSVALQQAEIHARGLDPDYFDEIGE